MSSDASHDDDFIDDAFGIPCPHCSATGEVNCHCGGDLCVCENYGDAPCPVCLGDGDVSEATYERYEQGRRNNAAAMADALAKAEGK